MLPIRWDPFRELNTLQKEMDDLFRRSFGRLGHEGGREREDRQWLAPLVDTFVKGKNFHVKAELPGVSKDDIEVSVEGNILTLKGERKEDKESKEKDYFLRESSYGSFVRKLTLPEGAKTDDVRASFENGVLEITVPFDKKAIAGRKVMIEGSAPSEKEKKTH